MTIGVIYTILCDGCDTYFETGFSPRETRREAKEAGWHYIRAKDYMLDLCPACWAKREKGERK